MTRRLVVVALGAASAAAWASGASAGTAPATSAAPATQVAPVQAVGPSQAADRPGFSVAGLVGVETSGFGFGIGARAGYALPFHLYLGGAIGYNFGAGGTHVFSLAPEAGYDFALPIAAPILIRPYLGLGFSVVSIGGGSETNNGVTLTVPGGTAGAFLFSPGVLGLYDVAQNVFVGVDLRVPIYSAGSSASFAGFLTGGYRM
jgi:hypothetical protein